MDNTTHERRYKQMYVSPGEVIRVIDGIRHEYLSVPDSSPLPDNARVVDVHYDIGIRGFSVLLFSPDWDVVEEGATVPRITEPFRVHVVQFRQGKDGKWGVAEENPLTQDLTCGDCEEHEGGNYLCLKGRGQVTEEAIACVKIVLSEEAKE